VPVQLVGAFDLQRVDLFGGFLLPSCKALIELCPNSATLGTLSRLARSTACSLNCDEYL
jgi:hypothetical protein